MKTVIRTIRALVLGGILILSSTVTPAYAQIIDFSTNDIRLYDPNAEDPIACGGMGGELAGNNNLQKGFNYFTSRGLSENQAAGAMGNIYEESGGDPTIKQGGGNTNDPSQFGTDIGIGKAWGLIQWDAGGRAIEYAETAGITDPIYLLKTQLDLIWWHMENSSPTGYSNMLENYMTIEDIAEATHDFHKKIEGSADTIDMIEERVTSAMQILEQYGSGASGPTIPIDEEAPGAEQALSDLCVSGQSGSVVKTALNYAWPDVSFSDRKTLKPEYKVAIDKALANNEYVGPREEPGVDCGGFVTRVMRDSGVDPTYNSTESGVAAQLEYLKTSGKYEEVDATSTADLLPGDIGIRSGGDGYRHTYIFVGENDYLENGNQVAEASYGGFGGDTLWLAPQAGFSAPYSSSYEYYRFVGEGNDSGGNFGGGSF